MNPLLARSVLFTPGTQGERVAKAIAAGLADVVVADLEDAVAPAEKAEARRTVRAALEGAGPSRTLAAVRVNTWASGLAVADLEAVVPARPGLVVLPKVERAAHVIALDVTLTRLERAAGLASGATRLGLVLETARGVLDAEALGGASPRVAALLFGAEDLAADAGLRRTRDATEVLYARSRVALAAAAVGAVAVDQVYVDLDDLAGLGAEARFARTLGYRGKMVLHPRQVDPVHAAFAPTADEVAAARRLVEAVEAGRVAEGGVLRFEGRMIDVPLIEQARRVLREAGAPKG